MVTRLRMRFQVKGCKNRHWFNLVVANNRKFRRDGKHFEQIGTYDPYPNQNNEKMVLFDFDRIRYWLGVGAEPTPMVAHLLGLAGILPVYPPSVRLAEKRRGMVEEKKRREEKEKLEKEKMEENQKLEEQKLEENQKLDENQNLEENEKLDEKQKWEEKQKMEENQKLDENQNLEEKQNLEENQKLEEKQNLEEPKLEDNQKLDEENTIEESKESEPNQTANNSNSTRIT